jgi:protein-S-isoprenylcysteine O-methyltransferase Ste14
MKKRIKIHGFLIFLAVSAILVFPDIFLRDTGGGFSDEILAIVGIALVLLGQLFRLSSRGFKSELSRNGAALVESGPYSFVRNPMYLGIILIGSGLVMVIFKWWAICAFLLIFGLIYIRLIFQEEKKLIQLFPVAYPTYKAKVPAIVPSLKMLAQTEVSSYLPLKYSWLKREIGSISGVLIFILLVRSWENMRAGGYILCLERFVALLFMIFLAAGLAAYLIRKTDAVAKNS